MADDQDVEWRTEGSDYLWRRVRRTVIESGKIVGHSDGSVVGWLDAETSDYICESTGEAAPLFHGAFLGLC